MSEEKKKTKSLFANILFNIAIPVLILSKLTTQDRLGPVYGLLLALLFPVIYFTYEYITEHKANFISILGFVSILLTGIIGVFEFPSEWIAFKEASVPLLIGLAVLISLWTPYPLIRKLLYNEELVDVNKIEATLKAKDNEKEFDKVLTYSTIMLAGSFFLSSILNFVLAKILIHSPSGTEEFTHELAKMTALSYPVIALPSTIVMMLALWYLFSKVKKLTGLEIEEMLAPHLQEKMK